MLELNLQPGRDPEFSGTRGRDPPRRANEAGTLNYEWSLSADGAGCHIFERYIDSAAVMAHLGVFGEKFGDRFLELLQPVRLVVYGSPNEQVKAALAAFNPAYMQPAGGFSR